MPYPNHPGKHEEEALVDATRYLEYLRSIGKSPSSGLPPSMILLFQSSLLEHATTAYEGTFGDGYLKGVFLPDAGNGRVGVWGAAGIGAPTAALRVEEMIAFGARKVVVIGTAGTLQPDLGIGDTVLCTKALRDEGSSHHYLPPATWVEPSASLTGMLAEALNVAGHRHRTGPSWTIDTPYRETVAEVRRYQAEGVCTVEMEAAAVFAVAAVRDVESAALFAISDSLADLRWDPRFGSEEVKETQRTLLRLAIAALAP